jgi:hypothetical protein
MPHVQVALLHSFAEYERLYEEALKWRTFPYAEAAPHLRAINERQKEELKKADGRPVFDLASFMLPALQKVFAARARTDRKIAALRCVEAVRLYAAGHGGKLPPTLAAIQEVPVPADPYTGKPFVYRLAGGVATLEGPPPAGEQANAGNALRYDLVVGK